jgi:hypothetical protein
MRYLNGFVKKTQSVLGPKLDRALSGTIDPAKETHKNSDGRNTMFELSLAAEWRRSGLNVEIGEPDIKLTVGNQVFLVECKRPFTWPGIVSCLRHAQAAITRTWSESTPRHSQRRHCDPLNRVINEGQLLFFTESVADKVRVGDLH